MGISLYLPNYEILINDTTDQIKWQQTEITNCPNDECQKAIGSTVKILEKIIDDYSLWNGIKNALFIIGIILIIIPILPKIFDYVMALF